MNAAQDWLQCTQLQDAQLLAPLPARSHKVNEVRDWPELISAHLQGQMVSVHARNQKHVMVGCAMDSGEGEAAEGGSSCGRRLRRRSSGCGSVLSWHCMA